MGQTTDAKDFTEALVFISPDGATWYDLSGHGAAVSAEGEERTVGEENTFSGDIPIVKPGKRNMAKVTVRYVYTEETSDPFDIVHTQHETAGGALHVQYSVDGDWWWKTGAGILVKSPAPGGDAKSGSVVMSEFVVACAAMSKADAST